MLLSLVNLKKKRTMIRQDIKKKKEKKGFDDGFSFFVFLLNKKPIEGRRGLFFL